MRRYRLLKNPLGWLLLLLAIGWQVWTGLESPPRTSKPETSQRQRRDFERLAGARLHEDRNNDGDSFKVLHQGQVHEFRLYFADCPEKRRHSLNGERLRDQGKYFGGLSEEETIAVGQRAQAFTRELLQTKRFTIHTQWQRVYDSGRFYAFVIFDDGEDLSAKLVREGLARIHTGGVQLPDGRSAKTYRQQLRMLEAEAKQAGRGGWRH